MMITAAIALVGFAAAGALGAATARALTDGRTASPDGPRPMQPHVLAFAAIGAALGAALAVRGATPLQLVLLATVAVALSACAYADLRCGLVPDAFTLVPLGALVLSGSLHGSVTSLAGAAIAALPFAAAALASHGRGMGWGDVKLAALGGALLGPAAATLALACACGASFVIARVAGTRGQPVAFAPYLAAAIGCGALGGIVVS